jgi:AcrR family transcriptional regulator
MVKNSKPHDLREACVHEAMAIIAEQGLDCLSLRDVARRLGVSHQAPYKHFESRDHILAEIVSRAYADFASYLDKRTRGKDPYDDLGKLGDSYLTYAAKHPLRYQLMFGTPLPDARKHPEMLRQAQHAFASLRAAIAQLPDRQRSEAEIDLDALFAWSSVHGLASILKTQAGENAGFSDNTIKNAARHILGKIGDALGAGKSTGGKPKSS